jgi:hypothetical protein
VRETLQKELSSLWRSLLPGGEHHIQNGHRAPAHGDCRTQQMPASILLQVRPIDDDDGLLAADQPPGHGGVDVLALGMQMVIDCFRAPLPTRM